MSFYKSSREYSDQSSEMAIYYMGEYLRKELMIPKYYTEFLKKSSFYDDTRNCIDFDFEMPKIKFSHRARNKDGDIFDITIKTQNKYGKHIKSEFDKLKDYDVTPDLKLLYFYCFYDTSSQKITRYIIYDLKKLIQMNDFKNRQLFLYKDDKINTKDGGSHFNCITVKKLNEAGCLLQDYSKIKP